MLYVLISLKLASFAFINDHHSSISHRKAQHTARKRVFIAKEWSLNV